MIPLNVTGKIGHTSRRLISTCWCVSAIQGHNEYANNHNVLAVIGQTICTRYLRLHKAILAVCLSISSALAHLVFRTAPQPCGGLGQWHHISSIYIAATWAPQRLWKTLENWLKWNNWSSSWPRINPQTSPPTLALCGTTLKGLIFCLSFQKMSYDFLEWTEHVFKVFFSFLLKESLNLISIISFPAHLSSLEFNRLFVVGEQ